MCRACQDTNVVSAGSQSGTGRRGGASQGVAVVAAPSVPGDCVRGFSDLDMIPLLQTARVCLQVYSQKPSPEIQNKIGCDSVYNTQTTKSRKTF